MARRPKEPKGQKGPKEPVPPPDPMEFLGMKRVEIPRGYWVYALLDATEDVFYVGQSENLASRIGRHVEAYGARLVAIRYLECRSEQHMYVTEQWLIDMLQPPMNVLGTEVEARMREMRRRISSGGVRWDGEVRRKGRTG